MTPAWSTSWGTSWATAWGAGDAEPPAAPAPGSPATDISQSFAEDHGLSALARSRRRKIAYDAQVREAARQLRISQVVIKRIQRRAAQDPAFAARARLVRDQAQRNQEARAIQERARRALAGRKHAA